MIVFVGTQERGFFVTEVAKKHGWDTAFISASLTIDKQVNDILKQTNCQYIVYDIEQYGESAEIIADVIRRIQKANNAVPVIFAPGYSHESDIVKFLMFKGVQYFIFADWEDEKKTQLEQAVQGFVNSNDFENNNFSIFENTEKKKEDNRFRTIGIAGVVSRIGTTTQAIQIVKYLLFKGYSACYIQMNNHRWVEELAEAYEGVEEDKEIGLVRYKEVDMYCKLEKLQDVMKKGYDFFVYDYGVYRERDFNKVSFLEKDLEMFMVGTKPGEFMRTYELIENNFYNNVIYIFNFVPDDKEEREDIYDLMQDKKDMTFFAKECRNPFRFVPSDFYEKVIPVASIAKSKPKEKKSFWKRRK